MTLQWCASAGYSCFTGPLEELCLGEFFPAFLILIGKECTIVRGGIHLSIIFVGCFWVHGTILPCPGDVLAFVLGYFCGQQVEYHALVAIMVDIMTYIHRGDVDPHIKILEFFLGKFPQARGTIKGSCETGINCGIKGIIEV